MLTQINTYEGVPVGSNNFDDFLGYVRAFLGANFGFSVNALDNSGGYFSDDNFVYETFGGANANNRMFSLLPSLKDEGNLFGRYNEEYFRFSVAGPSSETPQIYRWDVLPSNGQEVGNSYRFSNIDEDNRVLPYNPINLVSDLASRGYNYVSYNGIYQEPTHYSVSFPVIAGDFREQHLNITNVQLGAESPVPIKTDERLKNVAVDGVTFNTLSSDFDNTLKFPHTNFSLEGYIFLTRQVGNNTYYVYVPQDESIGDNVTTGTYKVLNPTRGLIEIRLSDNQLTRLIDPIDPFDEGDMNDVKANMVFYVMSGEQLLVDREGSITNYRSRYGEVYNGDDSEVTLLRLVFDGDQYQITEIPEGEISSFSGSILLQDSAGIYADSTILARRYLSIPNMSEYERVQQNRYVPDLYQLYYHVGIIDADVSGNTSNIRAMVEQNPSSWYNQKSSTAQYFPVNRGVSTYVSYITNSEAQSLNFETFNPSVAFQIVDTIALKDLNDVYGPDGTTLFSDVYFADPSSLNNTILKFDSGSGRFIARSHTLNQINNVNAPSPGNNSVLTYISGSTNWQPRTIEQILGYVPADDADTSNYVTLNTTQTITGVKTFDNLRISLNNSLSIFGPAGPLATVLYIDGVDSNVKVGNVTYPITLRSGATPKYFDGVSNYNMWHEGNFNPNNKVNTNASITPGTNTKITYDAKGLVTAGTSLSSSDIPNLAASKITSGTFADARISESSVTQHITSYSTAQPNGLMRRDGSGKSQVATPSGADPGTTIATKSYVDTLLSNLDINSYASNWIRVGDFILAWTDAAGSSTEINRVVWGPILPSGSYGGFYVGWAVSKTNLTNQHTAVVSVVSTGSSTGGGGWQPTMTITVRGYGHNAWGARCFWVVRKAS